MMIGGLIRNSVVVAVLALGVAGCQTTGTTSGPSVAGTGQGDHRQEASGMVFPEVLASFQRTSIIQYNKTGTDTSGGYAASTDGGRAILTLYVYAGLPGPAQGEEFKKQCDAHFQSVKNQALGANPYRSTGDQSVTLQKGGKSVTGRYAEFVGGGRASRAYLFCNEGSPWLVKLRITYPDNAAPEKLITPMLEALPWPTKTAWGTV